LLTLELFEYAHGMYVGKTKVQSISYRRGMQNAVHCTPVKWNRWI